MPKYKVTGTVNYNFEIDKINASDKKEAHKIALALCDDRYIDLNTLVEDPDINHIDEVKDDN